MGFERDTQNPSPEVIQTPDLMYLNPMTLRHLNMGYEMLESHDPKAFQHGISA